MSETMAAPPAQPAGLRSSWLLPLALYCAGHFVTDIYQSALSIMQPALEQHFRLNFTESGIIAGVFLASSSMVQPLYGYICDRIRSRLFSALGPAVVALFISFLAWGRGFGGLLAMVALAGIGVAAFHPQAAANVIAGITRNRSTAMSFFVSAGSIGMAIGPLLFSALLESGGLRRAAYGVAPGLAVTLLLIVLLPPVREERVKRPTFAWAPLRAVWKPMTILFLLVMIRSIVSTTFTQFLPLYLDSTRHYSLGEASLTLAVFLLSGAVGGLAGGRLADRFGGRSVILLSMIGSVPFLALFVFGRGFWSLAGLIVGGTSLLFTMPVNIVIAQELAPTQAGTVSALMMGFAWGTAGLIFIPLTGWASDLWSMQTAFAGLIVFPLIGFLIALKLPRDAGNAARAASA